MESQENLNSIKERKSNFKYEIGNKNNNKYFIQFIDEILPYLKQIKYLKSFFIKYLKETLVEELMKKDLINKNNPNENKNFIIELIIQNLFFLFNRISSNNQSILPLNILCFVGNYKNECSLFSKKYSFNSEYQKEFEKEAQKMIILHDEDCDQKLNFNEFLGLLNFKVEKNIYSYINNKYDFITKELIVIEKENLNFIFINLLTDYLKFLNFFHNKLNDLYVVYNIEIFDIFLNLDKNNKNKFSFEDFKNFINNDMTYNEDSEKIQDHQNYIFLNDSEIKLFFDFLNIFKSKNYNENMQYITILEFEKIFSISNDIIEDYYISKALKKSKTLGRENKSKNDIREEFTIKDHVLILLPKNKNNSGKIDIYSKDFSTNLDCQEFFNQNFDNTIVAKDTDNPIQNIIINNENFTPFELKVKYFKEYFLIYLNSEENLEQIRYKLAYKSYFNPKYLYEFLTKNSEKNIFEFNSNIESLNDIELLSLSSNLSHKNRNMDLESYDEKTKKNCIKEAKSIFVENLNQNLKSLHIYLTDREIEVFCSCFNYNSIEKFLCLFISGLDNPRKIVLNRISRQEEIKNKIPTNSINKIEEYPNLILDEETRNALNSFIEKLVFYEDKKEFFRKKIFDISNDYLDLFHYLDISEKGYLIEKDVKSFFIFI